MTSDTYKRGELLIDTTASGGFRDHWSSPLWPWPPKEHPRVFMTTELDYAGVERNLLAWLLGGRDEPIPGMPNTWRRVPLEFDVFEPIQRAQLEPGGITYRVSAELVQLGSHEKK